MNDQTAQPVIIVTEPLSPGPMAWLSQQANVVEIAPDDLALESALQRAQGLIVRTYTRITTDLLAMAPALKVVGRAGVGIDNIDLDACRERGVRVVHTPGVNAPAVAEFVFATLLDVVRPRASLARAIGPDEWSSLRASLTPPVQLAGMTLGIVGLGAVGTRVARLGSALGMRVLYHDIRDVHEYERGDAEPMPLDMLLNTSDVVTLHADGRPENRNMLGERELGLLKPSCVLINTARGMLIDQSVLAAHLTKRPETRAILDVHEPEPVTKDSPLMGLPNAMLYPHIAGATRPAKEAMSWVVRDVVRVLEGEVPEHSAV